MKIKDAMNSPAEWVAVGTLVSEVAARMASADIGANPVGHNDRLVAMITDRDLTLRVVGQKRNPETIRADEVMTPGIVNCCTTEDVEDEIHLMDQNNVCCLPMLNDRKRLLRMQSPGDLAHGNGLQLAGELARALARHLR